ncbi:MAG: hypothetical protein JSW11_17110 [Candidatus Heimdallarchaeota archaeon]|nr:MAG: hypothetical protein JSW11_17110 [Candidatus Heimdallarchaeota archaeon]
MRNKRFLLGIYVIVILSFNSVYPCQAVLVWSENFDSGHSEKLTLLRIIKQHLQKCAFLALGLVTRLLITLLLAIALMYQALLLA